VSSVGDLDGDGAGDFVIGGAGDCIYGSHRLSGDPRGAFFAYGPLSDGVVVDDLVNVEADPYYYQSLGASAANLGDMTGDGVAEVALGAPGCWGSGWDTGIVYVHNGPPAGGDGAPDVILGVANADGAGGLSAGGQALLFYGPVTGTWTSDDADFTIKGAESYDSVGINVQFLDDVNTDDSDDMLVGSFGRTSDDGRSYAGAVGLFFSGVSE
jgi:hypothetical protein